MNPLLGNKLKELVEEYLVDYCEIERGFTPKTVKGKTEALNRFLSFLKSRVWRVFRQKKTPTFNIQT